jgi:quercetin dioxygenase-like cupin family protein
MNTTLLPILLRRGESRTLSVFGVGVQVLAGAAQTGGAYAAYLATCPTGVGAPPHRHAAQDEAFLVLEGEFDLMLGEEVHRLKAGDFAAAPRGLLHAFTGAGPGASRLAIFSTPAGHEAFFEDCAAALEAGTFSPETGREICERHGIELVMPAT